MSVYIMWKHYIIAKHPIYSEAKMFISAKDRRLQIVSFAKIYLCGVSIKIILSFIKKYLYYVKTKVDARQSLLI